MKKILHVIPSDNTGGVEVAARSMNRKSYGEVNFEKYFIAASLRGEKNAGALSGPSIGLNNPANYLAAIRHILTAKPDLVIFSLWRSVLILLVIKLIKPDQKCVVFLHLPVPAHFLDWITALMAVEASDQIWVDSEATLRGRAAKRHRSKGRIISFLPARLPSRSRQISPRFIFWGRLRDQKNINRAIKLFSSIAEKYPDAHFKIIGPDGGEEAQLIEYTRHLDLSDHVSFLGEKSMIEIIEEAANASFFLQTSKIEGMCLAVVEAMQLGLVPIVTPVGEINNYCDSGNSIFVNNDETVIKNISSLLESPERYSVMSHAAARRWDEVELYGESVISNSLDAMNCD